MKPVDLLEATEKVGGLGWVGWVGGEKGGEKRACPGARGAK